MRHFLILSCLLFGTGATADEADFDFKSKKANIAIEKYEATIKKAKAVEKRNRVDLILALEAALKYERTEGELDEAIKIRDAIKALKKGASPAGGSEGRKRKARIPRQAKLPPWEDVDGNQFAHKNIIKPKLGEIHFKNGKVVRFSDLTSKDQKRARDLWGFKIIELNGIFRSNTGTLYAINEVAGEKVAVTMIDSPVFAKVEGTFERDKKFLQSRQWHIKFKKLHPINDSSLESRIRINKKGDVIAEVPKYILLPNGQIKWTKDFVKIRLEPVPYSHVPLRVRNTECRECDNAKGVQQIIIACRLIHLRNKRGILARQCLIQIIREKFPTLAKQDVLAIVDILVGLLVKPPEFKNDNDLEEKIKQRIQMRAVRLSKNTDVINFCMRFAKSAAPDTL